MRDQSNLKNVLVTGGAGYVGSHVVAALSGQGFKPVVLDDLSTGFKDAIVADAPFTQGDFGNEVLIEHLIKEYKVSSLIHFAAKISVAESVKDPVAYYDNNVVKALRLFETCRRNGIQNVVFSSTAAVYDPSDRPITEDGLLKPVNPYGRTKLATEGILQDLAAAYGFNFTILRYFNVAGADPNLDRGQASNNATHLIKIAAEASVGLRPDITIFGTDYGTPDGTCVRDYIHVADLSAAHVLALKALIQCGQSHIFNCGYGHGASVRQVLRAMQEVTGQSLKIHEGPRREGDATSLIADPQKIKALLGWHPKHDSLSEICRTAYLWERGLTELRSSGKWR